MIRKSRRPFKIEMNDETLEALSERSHSMTKVQALIDLISRRVSEPTEVSKNNRSFILQPGEAETSINVLAEQWGWDRKTVRRFLDTLQKTGCMKYKRYTYGTVAVFPCLNDSPSQDESYSPAKNNASSSTTQLDVAPFNPSVQKDSSGNMKKTSIRYDAPPLTLDDEVHSLLKNIYDRFKARLPLLHMPPYNQRTEKAIYSVFIQGMSANEELLDKYLDTIAGDPMKNGEMAELTGDSHDRESFESLFSPRWEEILFPSNTHK